MQFKLLGLSLVTGMMSATAFAEPPIQPGDTLESLSKVKLSTTVNGQAGSIEELVSSGQIRIVDAGQIAAAANPAGSETEMQTSAETTASQAAPQNADLNTTAQNAESTQAGSETEVQTASVSDATAVHGTEMNTAAQAVDPATAQANTAAIEQTAQATSENVDPMQPNTALAAQQAEQITDQEIAAAPVNESPALAPADTTEATAPQEAFAATPDATQPDDAVQAAPEAAVTDAPVNAAPEAPMAEATEN